MISPTTIVVASGWFDHKQRLGERDNLGVVEKLFYGKPYPNEGDKKAFNTFLMTTNLTYMCRIIHSVLFNMVMPRVGLKDNVSDKDHFLHLQNHGR